MSSAALSSSGDRPFFPLVRTGAPSEPVMLDVDAGRAPPIRTDVFGKLYLDERDGQVTAPRIDTRLDRMRSDHPDLWEAFDDSRMKDLMCSRYGPNVRYDNLCRALEPFRGGPEVERVRDMALSADPLFDLVIEEVSPGSRRGGMRPAFLPDPMDPTFSASDVARFGRTVLPMVRDPEAWAEARGMSVDVLRDMVRHPASSIDLLDDPLGRGILSHPDRPATRSGVGLALQAAGVFERKCGFDREQTLSVLTESGIDWDRDPSGKKAFLDFCRSMPGAAGFSGAAAREIVAGLGGDARRIDDPDFRKGDDDTPSL